MIRKVLYPLSPPLDHRPAPAAGTGALPRFELHRAHKPVESPLSTPSIIPLCTATDLMPLPQTTGSASYHVSITLHHEVCTELCFIVHPGFSFIMPGTEGLELLNTRPGNHLNKGDMLC